MFPINFILGHVLLTVKKVVKVAFSGMYDRFLQLLNFSKNENVDKLHQYIACCVERFPRSFLGFFVVKNALPVSRNLLNSLLNMFRGTSNC